MTNPNDPIGVDSHAVFVPKGMPQEWVNKVLSLEVTAKGMTKREWFAGLAMQGILANLHTFEQGKYKREGVQVTPSVTLLAVDVADKLIEDLNKETK